MREFYNVLSKVKEGTYCGNGRDTSDKGDFLRPKAISKP